jgi:HD-GYP domain-containing protein (c-di-GMP phosphodiesterase class II)
LSHGRAMEQLDWGAGSQFDPAVVEATIALLCGNGGAMQQLLAAHP